MFDLHFDCLAIVIETDIFDSPCHGTTIETKHERNKEILHLKLTENFKQLVIACHSYAPAQFGDFGVGRINQWRVVWIANVDVFGLLTRWQ